MVLASSNSQIITFMKVNGLMELKMVEVFILKQAQEQFIVGNGKMEKEMAMDCSSFHKMNFIREHF